MRLDIPMLPNESGQARTRMPWFSQTKNAERAALLRRNAPVPILCAEVPMRADIVPGAVFPDYELSDYAAKRRKLSELQGHDRMILVLSRGAFCPKDRRQAEGLLLLRREMEVGYCRLVTLKRNSRAMASCSESLSELPVFFAATLPR
jgi:hypothetical protein